MPIYEYQCEECDTRFEMLVRFGAQETVTLNCPQCGGGEVTRLVSLFSAFGAGDNGQMKRLGGSVCSTCPITDCSACTLPRG